MYFIYTIKVAKCFTILLNVNDWCFLSVTCLVSLHSFCLSDKNYEGSHWIILLSDSIQCRVKSCFIEAILPKHWIQIKSYNKFQHSFHGASHGCLRCEISIIETYQWVQLCSATVVSLMVFEWTSIIIPLLV